MKKIIILLVLSLIISIFPTHLTSAEDTSELTLGDTAIIESLEDELSEENISLENLKITTEELLVETTVENAEGDTVEVTLQVEPGANTFTLITKEFDESGAATQKEYIVKIEQSEDVQSEDVQFEASFEDIETGEIFTYNSEEGTASLVFLIPIGIALSPAVLTALFHTGAMIIVGGSAMVIATKAKTTKGYYHFQASVQKGGVYIGKGLSKNSAILRLRQGSDTYSTSSNQAKTVAAGANPVGKPFLEVDQYDGKPRKGHYYHWHPYKRIPKAHAFYGQPV